ncbi:hypothetical protein ATER59S_02393 [Aquamicrobium terrae]
MNAREMIRVAANAHTRLNTFYSLIAILEGGCLPNGSETASETAGKIIRLCKAESGRQLQIYDKAAAAIRAMEVKP